MGGFFGKPAAVWMVVSAADAADKTAKAAATKVAEELKDLRNSLTPPPRWNLATTLTAFQNENGDTARVAATRLALMKDAIPELVKLYNSGSDNLKARVLWTLEGSEEARKMLFDAAEADPARYDAEIVSSARKILPLLKWQKFSAAEKTQAEAKAKADAAATRKNLSDLTARQEELKRLQQDLADKVTKLGSTTAEWNRVATKANLYHNQRYAQQAKALKSLAESQAAEVSRLRRELVRESAKLRKELAPPPVVPCCR